MNRSRALSNFIAISRWENRDRLASRLKTWLCVVAAALAVWAWASPANRLGLSELAMFTLLCLWSGFGKNYLGGLSQDSPKRSWLEALDRARAQTGLNEVLAPDQLARLEGPAQNWEEIESILSSNAWRGRPGLSARIQASADDYMTNLVLSVVGGGSNFTPEHFSNRIEMLLQALQNLDTFLFSYARSSGAPVDAPSPGLDVMARLEEALIH